MDYLNTAFRNSVAYFILNALGVVETLTSRSGIEANYGAGVRFALMYSGINEALDFMDDGKSHLTQGNYFRSVDGVIWNLLYVLGIQKSRFDHLIDDVLDNFGVPSGDIRVSVINGVLITMANLVRDMIDRMGPKQLRIVTQPSSFVYAQSTGNGNIYL